MIIYICYDYTKGANEYIIIDLVELAKVEFKEDIKETVINEIFAELDSESSHRFWNFTNVELINSEIKMNLV